MTVRTKSKPWQWTVWLCAALALLAVYVVLSRILFNFVTWDLFAPRLHRLAIPLVVVFFYVAWNTRWDGVRREKKEKKKVKGEGQGQGEEKVDGESRWRAEEKPDSPVRPADDGRAHTPGAPQSSDNADSLGNDCGETGVSAQPQHNEIVDIRSSTSTLDSSSLCQPPNSTSSLTGEELFEQARALPHQVVPDFDSDGPYLELLGQSAKQGYSPALAKLGEYAMRRAAWVEAYYWMKLAQRNGMLGLSPTLREIRKNWSLDGFPGQSSNVNWLFTLEAGSLGRALLHVDSGHEAATAKEYLKANYPEFLT